MDKYTALLTLFDIKHLPVDLQQYGKQFYDIALNIRFKLPDCEAKENAMLDLLVAREEVIKALM